MRCSFRAAAPTGALAMSAGRHRGRLSPRQSGWVLPSPALPPVSASRSGILPPSHAESLLREMPREVQVIAYEKGMIPYIPTDQE
jgi:hypothetical protein